MGLGIGIVLLLGIIAVADIVTGNQTSMWLPYALPIALSTWRLGLRAGLVVTTVACALIFLVGYFYGYPFSGFKYFIGANVLIFLGLYLIAYLVNRLRCKEVTRIHIGKS